jgi:hypothetical protein
MLGMHEQKVQNPFSETSLGIHNSWQFKPRDPLKALEGVGFHSAYPWG